MKKILSIFLVTLTITASTTYSQDSELREFLVDTLEIAGGVYSTPIGVDEMKYVGNRFITAEDTVVMNYISRIVQFDVDFHADFELIPIDSFFIKMYDITELDILGWQRLGADLLVKLEAEFPGKNVRVRWRLYDTIKQQRIGGSTVTGPKNDWRNLGHKISNEIVKTLTGEDGIYLTKICYIKKNGDAKEVCIADYDGALETQLTNTGTINISPFFHPNGKEIYFTSYLEGDPKLFKVNIKTKKLSKVAEFKGIVAAPAISPDGNKIACVLSKDGNSEIYVIGMNGKIIKRLTNNRAIDTAPTWSPDSRMIGFSSDRSGSPQVYIMDSDGLNVRRLTYQSRYNDSPIWSSRGDRITFVSRTKYGRFDLASIDTSGTDYRIFTEIGQNENPHFSPNGKHIIFSSTRRGPRDIYTMDINGINQRRLTRSGNCSNPNWGPVTK